MYHVVRFLSASTLPYSVLSSHATLKEAQAAHAAVYRAASPADQAAATFGIVDADTIAAARTYTDPTTLPHVWDAAREVLIDAGLLS